MQYSSDICKLVLENVILVEEAEAVLYSLEEELVKNIWDSIRNQLQKRGYFNIAETRDGDHFFWASGWAKTEDDSPQAKFWLDCEGDGCDRSWLSVLGGLVPGTKGGLFLWYDWSAKGISKREWKSFLQNFFIANPALQDNGFILNNAGTAIIKTVKINLSCLADNLKNPQDCFDDIDAALEAIYAQRQVFEKLLNEAEKIRP